MNSTVSKNVFTRVATVVAAITVSATVGFGQVEQPSRISIQGTGIFTKASNDQAPSHEATKSGGFLVGYSYQFSRWIGAEGNYGFTRNTQKYVTTGGSSSLESDFHELTGVATVHIPSGTRNVEPYVLGGGGALVFDPTEKIVVSGAGRQTRGTFVYGGGANFRVNNTIAIRAEYRGFVYKAPDFGVDALNLDKFTHLAQPSAGLVFRF